MRSPEETLNLLKSVIENRRQYVRAKLAGIEQNGRKVQPQLERALRGGMLSELTTITGVIQMIEDGRDDPLTWWVEKGEEDDGTSKTQETSWRLSQMDTKA